MKKLEGCSVENGITELGNAYQTAAEKVLDFDHD